MSSDEEDEVAAAVAQIQKQLERRENTEGGSSKQEAPTTAVDAKPEAQETHSGGHPVEEGTTIKAARGVLPPVHEVFGSTKPWKETRVDPTGVAGSIAWHEHEDNEDGALPRKRDNETVSILEEGSTWHVPLTFLEAERFKQQRDADMQRHEIREKRKRQTEAEKFRAKF